MSRCRKCLDSDVGDQGCSHCVLCGIGGVSHDPRFQRGDWCDVCLAEDDLKTAKEARDRET